MNIKKTANLFANFTIKRIAEILGITVLSAGVLLLLALLTYSPEDPNFIFPENTKIENILGFHGSFISDLFFCQQKKGFYICTPAFSEAEKNLCSLKY